MILKIAYKELDPEDNSYWNNMRNRDHSASFPAVKDFIHQNAAKMKRPNRRRNRITWAVAVLLPLLILFSCKRKTYIEPQGATLSFTAKDSVQSTFEFLLPQYAEKEWQSVLR